MNEYDLSPGEYVRFDKVMTYLKIFDWHMSREDLIERFRDIRRINLTESDCYKVINNKILNGHIE